MEQRILMTTLLGGERFTYTDARGNTILAQLNGASLATELIAATQDGTGNLLFGDIEGTVRQNGDPTAPVDPRNGAIVGNGAIPVSGGLQGSATLGFGRPGGSVNFGLNFGGIAANRGGATFGFNITTVDQNNKPLATFPVTGDVIPTAAPSGGTVPPVPYDLLLFQINTNPNPPPPGAQNSGNAFNFQDLSVVLEGADDDVAGIGTGVAALEPDLLQATKVSIAGAAFNPADGLLYFDLQFTPKPPSGGVTIPQQDVLYSVDPSAGPAVNEDPTLTTVRRIGNLDNAEGVYTISALAFKSTGFIPIAFPPTPPTSRPHPSLISKPTTPMPAPSTSLPSTTRSSPLVSTPRPPTPPSSPASPVLPRSPPVFQVPKATSSSPPSPAVSSRASISPV
jgi:hypothetical protein